MIRYNTIRYGINPLDLHFESFFIGSSNLIEPSRIVTGSRISRASRCQILSKQISACEINGTIQADSILTACRKLMSQVGLCHRRRINRIDRFTNLLFLERLVRIGMVVWTCCNAISSRLVAGSRISNEIIMRNDPVELSIHEVWGVSMSQLIPLGVR